MPNLSEQQFQLIAKLLQSKEPACGAAYLVLVKDRERKAAQELTGLSPQSLSNVIRRFKRTDMDIRQAYGLPQPEKNNQQRNRRRNDVGRSQDQ